MALSGTAYYIDQRYVMSYWVQVQNLTNYDRNAEGGGEVVSQYVETSQILIFLSFILH